MTMLKEEGKRLGWHKTAKERQPASKSGRKTFTLKVGVNTVKAS